MAFRVEQPAVIAAADAAFLDPAVEQGRSAVHAARVEQPGPARAVAEQDQLLVQDLHQPREARRLLRAGQGLPVAPEQLASQRARSAAHHVLVGPSCRTAIGAAHPIMAGLAVAWADVGSEVHRVLHPPAGS